jgi:hypothetical protein
MHNNALTMQKGQTNEKFRVRVYPLCYYICVYVTHSRVHQKTYATAPPLLPRGCAWPPRAAPRAPRATPPRRGRGGARGPPPRPRRLNIRRCARSRPHCLTSASHQRAPQPQPGVKFSSAAREAGISSGEQGEPRWWRRCGWHSSRPAAAHTLANHRTGGRTVKRGQVGLPGYTWHATWKL